MRSAAHETPAAVAASLPRPGGRFPSLDGLRALSIGLVLLSHLWGTRHFVGTAVLSWLEPLGDLGHLGVGVFFVISGFLITSLLLKELESTQRISLREFYIRRALRIFPAYYALLAVTAVAGYAGLLTLQPGDMLHAFTYTFNYHHQHAWYLGHTWSLSIEEQFYLLWPAVLCLGGKRAGMMTAAACLIASPLLRTGIWYFAPELRPGIGLSFPTVADALATGCLLAGFRDTLGAQRWFQVWARSWYFLLVPAAVLGANMLGRSPRIAYPLGQSVANLAIALVIDWCIRFASSPVGRFLNTKPMVWVGTLSYSLYLWQQVFLNRSATGAIHSFPYNITLALVVASVSYYCIEKPSLAMRGRLTFSQRRTRRASTITPPASPSP